MFRAETMTAFRYRSSERSNRCFRSYTPVWVSDCLFRVLVRKFLRLLRQS
jgi:hypothetical protein